MRDLPIAPLAETPGRLDFAGWSLDAHAQHLVSPAGLVVPLSQAEYRLLQVILLHPKRALTRDQLHVTSQEHGERLIANDDLPAGHRIWIDGGRMPSECQEALNERARQIPDRSIFNGESACPDAFVLLDKARFSCLS